MANQLVTRQEVTQETLWPLTNALHIVRNFTRDYEQEFGKKGAKIGATLQVRRPVRVIGRDGQAYQPEGLADTTVPIVVNQQSGVDFEFSTEEMYLSVDMLKERYLDKMGISIANKLDSRAALMAMQNTPNLVGTVGTTPGTNSTDAVQIYAQAGQWLEENGVVLQDHKNLMAVLTSAARVGWLTYTKQFFNPSRELTEQWRSGEISDALGYSMFVDNNVPVQTIGLLGGTPAVTTAGQTGTTINTNGWTHNVIGVLNVGDIISFAGVYAVNPQTRASYSRLQQFVIQAQASSDNTGAAMLTIFPALVPSGQYQNVSNSPAASGLINVYGAAAAGQSALSAVNTPQMMLWHKDAFAWVCFEGQVPDNAEMAFADHDDETGCSLRFVRMFDVVRDMWPARFDVYYGSGPLIPEASCRIAS